MKTKQQLYEAIEDELRLINHNLEQTRTEKTTPERKKFFIWQMRSEFFKLANKIRLLEK